MDRAAIVIGRGTQVIQIDDEELAPRHGHVPIRGETANTVMDRRGGNGVIDVNKMVTGEARIKRDTQQPALAQSSSCDRDERSWQQDPILDDAKLAPLQANEEPPVRCKVHRRRAAWRQVASHLRLAETSRKGSRAS